MRKKTSSQSVTDVAVDKVRENQSGGKHKKHPTEDELDDHNGATDGNKEVSRADEKLKDSFSKKRSCHHDEKYNSSREGGRENNTREQVEDAVSEKSGHKHSSSSNRHKKERSLSPRNRRKKNKTDSSISNGSSTNDESLDDSERYKSQFFSFFLSS